MSVLLFNPSTAPHVQQAARALHEAGQLNCYITSVRDDPTFWPQRLLNAAGRVAGRPWAREFSRRAVREVPAGKVESHPWGELLRLAVGRIDRGGRLTDRIWERTEVAFDRMVARRLCAPLAGVYGFEFGSLATFRRARALGMHTVYEVPAPDPAYVRALLEAELERFPELRTPYFAATREKEEARTTRRRAEWQSAELILVNSRFTRDSYARAGLDCSKVHVVPLGAPPPAPRDQVLMRAAQLSRPLALIWAGTFSVRKGAHHLLAAWRQGHLGRIAHLRVFGAVGLPDRMLRPLPDGVEFAGSVPRQILLDRLGEADALIFPTLCDGFGMVATEAWSRGVPVITTERAGVADLLQSGRNGVLVRPADPTAMIETVHWCAEHRGELQAMRESALATAAAWQWSDYRRAHAALLRQGGIFSAA